MRHQTGSSLVQIMTCRLFGAKPLSKQRQKTCLNEWISKTNQFLLKEMLNLKVIICNFATILSRRKIAISVNYQQCIGHLWSNATSFQIDFMNTWPGHLRWLKIIENQRNTCKTSEDFESVLFLLMAWHHWKLSIQLSKWSPFMSPINKWD